MKKLISLLLLFIIALVFSGCKDPYKISFYLEGKEYSMFDSRVINKVGNYRYAPSNEPHETAESFVQVYVFDGEISMQLRQRAWERIKGIYGLRVLEDNANGYIGSATVRGQEIVSYATSIRVAEKHGYICFIKTKPADFDLEYAAETANKIISQLKSLESQLQ